MVQYPAIGGRDGASDSRRDQRRSAEVARTSATQPSRHGDGRSRGERWVMKFGLSPLQAGSDFEETIRECERAEADGFESVWLGEHHDNRTLYPAPLIGLGAIAGRTRRGGPGAAVLPLPPYHPPGVAEEAAVGGQILGGRPGLGGGGGV